MGPVEPSRPQDQVLGAGFTYLILALGLRARVDSDRRYRIILDEWPRALTAENIVGRDVEDLRSYALCERGDVARPLGIELTAELALI